MENEDVSGWDPCICGKRALGNGRDFSVIGHRPQRYWCGDVACGPGVLRSSDAGAAETKLNLDDLESDARGTPVGLCPAEHRACMPPYACAATTLALIARIAELEQICYSVLSDEKYIDDIPALLQKGVVLRRRPSTPEPEQAR